MDEEPFENFQEQYFEDFDQQQETEQGKYISWLLLVPIIIKLACINIVGDYLYTIIDDFLSLSFCYKSLLGSMLSR